MSHGVQGLMTQSTAMVQGRICAQTSRANAPSSLRASFKEPLQGRPSCPASKSLNKS